jgi:hypothetical protein
MIEISQKKVQKTRPKRQPCSRKNLQMRNKNYDNPAEMKSQMNPTVFLNAK